MSKNPFLNALAATTYIVAVASVLFYSPKANVPEGVIIPIVMLSLFVLSAAMMGYFFLYQPLQLLILGRQNEATKLFLTTVTAFAGMAGAITLAWFLLSAVM